MVDKRDTYRLPWSMNDNPIAWIEVTDICNIHCEGCYRQYMTGHKPLEQLKQEVLFFKQWRNPDNFSIAGGELLIHPQIVELVAFIARQGIKPVILSNGQALTPELLHELKKAGLAGFTMHVDSHQNRPHWGENQKRNITNCARRSPTWWRRKVGCTWCSTPLCTLPTFHEIPDVMRWGQANIEKVQRLVFITYRTATIADNIATDKNDQAVDMSKLSYTRETFYEHFITAPEVYQLIKKHFPAYEASGYLGGSIRHDSYKWLIGAMVGSKRQMYGSVGKKTMELAQTGHHLWTGRYLAYL